MELDSLATEVNKILVTFTEREKNKGLGARKTSNDNITGIGRIKVYQCMLRINRETSWEDSDSALNNIP